MTNHGRASFRDFAIRSVAVLMSIGLLSCGGGGDAGEPETPRPDDPAAASLLLRLSDFPTGWTEDTSDDDSANPFDECQADDAPGLRGRAETGDFSGDGGNSYIGQALALFETVDAAAHSWDAFRPLAQCMVDLINDGILDDNEAEAMDASLQAMSFPSLGDATQANRITFTVKARGQSGPFNEVDVFLDVVWIQQEDAAFLLIAADYVSPFPVDMIEELATTTLGRLSER